MSQRPTHSSGFQYPPAVFFLKPFIVSISTPNFFYSFLKMLLICHNGAILSIYPHTWLNPVSSSLGPGRHPTARFSRIVLLFFVCFHSSLLRIFFRDFLRFLTVLNVWTASQAFFENSFLMHPRNRREHDMAKTKCQKGNMLLKHTIANADIF